MEQLTPIELKRELDRRIKQLETQRAEALEKLAEVDRQLGELGFTPGDGFGHLSLRAFGDESGSSSGRTPRKRPKNERPLIEVLLAQLETMPRTTSQLAEAALESGYLTTSRNFTNTVNVALHRDERARRVEGKWTKV